VKEKLIKLEDKFEKKRWPYVLSLPFFWFLTFYIAIKKAIYRALGKPKPKINSFWFDGLGKWTRKVKEGAASWKALDIIYNHPFNAKKGISGRVDHFWWSIQNCQAIRNRYKLVKKEVRKAIQKFANRKEVRLISLACGSAQAVIEIMSEFKSQGLIVKTLLVDIDQEALNYARGLAEENGVIDQIDIRKSNILKIVKIASDFKPQIIEMLGLLDYIENKLAIRLIQRIYESLGEEGIFLTCNIAPNIERNFVTQVINWPMVYRKPKELSEIIEKSGFSDFKLVYEPLKIHGLVIAQKT